MKVEAEQWPRILNGWLIDEAPVPRLHRGEPITAITATHLLSGVELRWRDDWVFFDDREGYSNRTRRVVFVHPAGPSMRNLTPEMDHDEALAYIETTVLGG